MPNSPDCRVPAKITFTCWVCSQKIRLTDIYLLAIDITKNHYHLFENSQSTGEFLTRIQTLKRGSIGSIQSMNSTNRISRDTDLIISM